MKIKKNKDLILLFILIPTFLLCAFYISSRMENQLPKYSVINKSRNGLSIFYETLRELNYPSDRTLKPINSFNHGDIALVADNLLFDIHNPEIEQWISGGGTLVYLTSQNSMNLSLNPAPVIRDNLKIYQLDKGTIITADINNFTNKGLSKNANAAYDLLKEVSYYGGKIYFNENHLFKDSIKKSLWDIVPLELKFVLYQLILILAGYFYYKGKRFGKPIPLYEEVERRENEYLYSAASLYRGAKCYDLILESFYKSLLKQLNSPLENWIDYWENQNIPKLSRAKRVYEFINSKNKTHSIKEYIEIITLIENLKSILKQRSEQHWKTLKKTQ